MSRYLRRTAIVAAIALAVGVTTAVSGVPAASGQSGDGAVPITVSPAPTRAATEASGSQTSPGSRGTGAFTESGLAPEATVVSDGTFDGKPAGAESVIGADGRVQVTNTTVYPASAIGQIEFNQNGDSFICTGWLIDANSILTSGHCSYDPTPGGGDIIEFAQFFPGRNGGTDPFGGCNVLSVFAKAGWRVNGNVRDDWSIQQLDCSIGDTVGFLGYFSLTAVNGLDGKTARVEGYPGDQLFGTHWKMSGTIATRTDANNIFYPMDTAGGQSGSPIMVANRPSCGGPCGMGIHSYGAGGNPPLNSGPRITNATFSLISDVADNNGG